MHPWCVQADLLRYANMMGTQVMAYSNLGGASYVEIGLAKETDRITELPLIKEIAARYSKTPA